LFGHVGITLGLSVGVDKALPRRGIFLSRLAAIPGAIDYRLVLLGSMLPDIIDKPVGHYFLAGTFNNGRIFAHTLLFFLLLLSVGLYRLWRGGRTGFLILALCSGVHLILDGMWRTPQTLYWPLHGWSFPQGYEAGFWHWLLEMVKALETNPADYIPEIIGLVIFVAIGLVFLRGGKLLYFLKSGALK
jgi:inner membrane protein